MGVQRMKEKDGFIKLEKGDMAKYFGYLDHKIEYPESIERIILEVILESLGIEYYACDNELKEMFKLIPDEEIESWISTIDELYSEEEKVNYNNIENPYLAYYLPKNTFKIHKLLRDLLMNGLIKVEADVLDIACGPGSATIGLIDFYKRLAQNLASVDFKLSITLLDSQEEFLNIAEDMLEKFKSDLPSNLEIVVHELICCKIDGDFQLEYLYDYIIVSNLLNGAELDGEFSEKRFFKEIVASTDESGAILIIEPGDEKQCERLKSIRNKVLKNLNNINMYSPCSNIWGEKVKYNCNCFTSGKLRWQKPYIIKKLIEKGLIKRSDELAFNYLILRKDGKEKYKKEIEDTDFTKVKDIPEKEGELVNVKGIVRCMMKKGNYLWISICDGTDIMAGNKHVHISININKRDIMKKWSNLLESMNVGDKIVARNVICEQMWKYKKSYLLNVNEDTEITGFFKEAKL